MIPQIPVFNTGKWKLDAKCAAPDIDPELFDIVTIKARFRGRVAEHEVEAAARELCQGCPVVQQCAAYALEQTKHCAGLVYAGTPTWPPQKAQSPHVTMLLKRSCSSLTAWTLKKLTSKLFLKRT